MTEPRSASIDELAVGAIDDVDAGVLRRTARIFDMLDPVPAGLVDRINFGLTLEALHAEIAVLQRGGELVGVRTETGDGVQTVTFTSATLTTMITVTPSSGDQVRIDGWIAPGARVSVELRAQTGSQQTVADDDGRFVFEDVLHGHAQFVLRAPGAAAARPVVTPTIEI